MSKRMNFPERVKVDAIKRANGKCENRACGKPLHKGQHHVDHIIPSAMGGKPILSNAQVLCLPCHAEKTDKKDKPAIAKAKRVEAKHLGAEAPKAKIPQRPKAEKVKREKLPMLPPVPLYRDAS